MKNKSQETTEKDLDKQFLLNHGFTCFDGDNWDYHGKGFGIGLINDLTSLLKSTEARVREEGKKEGRIEALNHIENLYYEFGDPRDPGIALQIIGNYLGEALHTLSLSQEKEGK